MLSHKATSVRHFEGIEFLTVGLCFPDLGIVGRLSVVSSVTRVGYVKSSHAASSFSVPCSLLMAAAPLCSH